MFAALHGELALHASSTDAASSDAYSLFVARSSALRLLAGAGESTDGAWGMNDAGLDDRARSESSRIAWFQVTLTGRAGGPLPVQAFLSCAGDVVARLGTARLDAVQILLPVESIDAALLNGGATRWRLSCRTPVGSLTARRARERRCG